MKRIFFVLAFAVLFGVSNSFAQFVFSVSLGIGFNSAKFGYKVNDKLVPYVGFQYLKAKYTWEETSERYDGSVGAVVEQEESTDFKGSLFIPNVGVKYFLTQKDKLKSFANVSFSKPFINGELEYDGEKDDEFEEDVDNLCIWGAEAGFGAEYFFDEHFSLGGEFGLRYYYLTYKEERESSYYDPSTGTTEKTDVDSDVNFALNPTYSKISLNFYF